MRIKSCKLTSHTTKALLKEVAENGGGGGIRTHVGAKAPHLISSQRRYDRFGTPPFGD